MAFFGALLILTAECLNKSVRVYLMLSNKDMQRRVYNARATAFLIHFRSLPGLYASISNSPLLSL